MYYEKAQPGLTTELIHQRDKDDRNVNYDIKGVREQLYEDFKGLCYLCGYSNPSNAIEHFRPHKKADRVKMFDWNNLFYACEHCNGIKGAGFENLLDCTKIKGIEQKIIFKYDPNQPHRHKVTISNNNSGSPDTIELLQLIFSIDTTSKRRMGVQTLEKQLKKELKNFDLFIDAWMADPNQIHEEIIKEQVNNTADFAAFKRWQVRMNPDRYPLVLIDWFVD